MGHLCCVNTRARRRINSVQCLQLLYYLRRREQMQSLITHRVHCYVFTPPDAPVCKRSWIYGFTKKKNVKQNRQNRFNFERNNINNNKLYTIECIPLWTVWACVNVLIVCVNMRINSKRRRYLPSAFQLDIWYDIKRINLE